MDLIEKLEKTKNMNVDMHIDDLAMFMFLKNKNNAIIELSLGGIESNKDLFFFCLDLLCKGLVLLFGNDRKVELDSLTPEAFDDVKKKMSLAGINVQLHIEQIYSPQTSTLTTDDDGPSDLVDDFRNAINLNELNMDVDCKQLEDYVFRMKMDKIIYNIAFNLVHRVI